MPLSMPVYLTDQNGDNPGLARAGGFTGFSTAQAFTRPANTTQYSVGQVIAESTTAANLRIFPNVTRKGATTGVLQAVWITDSSVQSTTPQINLWLFTGVITIQNDAAAFAPSSTDLQHLACAPILLQTWTGANANGVLSATNLALPFTSPAGQLWGVAVAANAYTPTSGEVFSITLAILQD